MRRYDDDCLMSGFAVLYLTYILACASMATLIQCQVSLRST